MKPRSDLPGPSEHGVLAGRPEFELEELEKLAEATKTDVGDWGSRPPTRSSVFAGRQRRTRPVIGSLGMQFVWAMPDTAPNASQEFMRIVTPCGKVGFVASEAINPLGSDQICYGKDQRGGLEDRRHDRRRISGRSLESAM